MGDFVTPSSLPKNITIEEQLPLFNLIPTPEAPTRTLPKRDPIYDFDFFVTEDCKEEGAKITEKWRSSDSLRLF
jgi:hypothetical protein